MSLGNLFFLQVFLFSPGTVIFPWFSGLLLVLWFSLGTVVFCFSGFFLVLRFSLGTVISLGNLVISRFSGFHLILLNSPGSVVYFWYCGFPWYCDVSLDNLGGGGGRLQVFWFSAGTLVFPVSLDFLWCCGFLLVL